MSMKLEVDSWDYEKAIEKIEKLLQVIKCTCENSDVQNIPSATLILDTVIDEII